MRPLPSRSLAVLLLLAFVPSLLPTAAWAQGGPPAPAAPATPQGSTAALDAARDLIRNGEYDGAIEILKRAIGAGQKDQLRDAYLLLIKTYFFVGNDLKFNPKAGREAANLNYQEARKLIEECLRTPGLQHTVPVPASDYPSQMIEAFNEIRGTLFGSFRISRLEPREAVALLDADTLRAFPGDTLLGDVDIPVGRHLVHLRAEGYKNVDEEVVIPPGSVLERSYQMIHQRSAVWYATASTLAVGAVAGMVALFQRHSSGSEPGNLPDPPPPPARRH
jgi:tetratricopeptide (TPR) repeat protein